MSRQRTGVRPKQTSMLAVLIGEIGWSGNLHSAVGAPYWFGAVRCRHTPQVAGEALVEWESAMQAAAVILHHQVADLPFVAIGCADTRRQLDEFHKQ
jgi:hypothetical protein